MEDLVKARLQDPDSRLTLLPESAFTFAVQQFVTKNESKAISDFIDEHLEQTQKDLTRDKTLTASMSASSSSSSSSS